MVAYGAAVVGFAAGLMAWAMVENRTGLLWLVFPLQITGLLMIRYGERRNP